MAPHSVTNFSSLLFLDVFSETNRLEQRMHLGRKRELEHYKVKWASFLATKPIPKQKLLVALGPVVVENFMALRNISTDGKGEARVFAAVPEHGRCGHMVKGVNYWDQH